MTGRDRLLTAMRGGKPDRVPVVVRGVAPWDDAWCAQRDPSWQLLIDAVRDRADYEAYFHTSSFLHTAHAAPQSTESADEDDWTLVTVRVHTPAGDLVTRYRASKRGLPGMCVEFPVREPAHVDWALSIPYEPLAPDLSVLAAQEAAVGDRGVVMLSLEDPISYVHGLLGSQLLALWSIDRPDLIDAMIAEFTRRVADTLAFLIDAGAGPVFSFTGTEYLSPPLASPAQFQRWIVEPETRFGEMIRAAGGIFWVHCHGPVSKSLDGFLAMGVNCLHPIEAPPMGDITLAGFRARAGNRLCIEGNIQVGDLYAASEAHVRAAVRTAIDEAGRDGAFILCPTASPHTQQLSCQTIANYLAYVDEGYHYGQ
jgi:hypothetical protein